MNRMHLTLQTGKRPLRALTKAKSLLALAILADFVSCPRWKKLYR